MRYESSVTSLSWIPSEAVEGTTRVPFEVGVAHYDPPPPDELGNLDSLREADRFRFANELSAWIEVDNGSIVDAGYCGGGQIGSTTVRVGSLSHVFQAVALPDIQRAPEFGDTWVRFSQTAGGRTGMPAPRTVRRAPFIQWQAPLAWTTLSLTLHAKGAADFEMSGASRFPRHWVYNHAGQLVSKSGLIDFQDWYRKSFGKHTPWGEQESEAFVTVVETALERSLSRQLMTGAAKPKIMKIDAGTSIVRQGERGSHVYLILDGVARIEVDGERLAEYGPGALLGERALLEGGERTSSIVAVTACRVASVPGEALDRSALEQLSTGQRREDASAG
ncbi:MAG TPA: cyclic nucleotide-binding domain-containing protein [Acidimicrobiales bacterium]|nr:cyclic nucleotide-binding domain-containing protein [Acidimicrobiales bacterium]